MIQVEERLAFLTEGTRPRKNLDVMKEAIAEAGSGKKKKKKKKKAAEEEAEEDAGEDAAPAKKKKNRGVDH